MMIRLGFSFALLISAFVMALGCKTVSVPHPVAVVVSTVVDCTEDAVRDTALHVLDDVTTAIIGGNWLDAVDDLAKRFGGDAVACSLAKIRGDGRRAALDGDHIEAQKAERADAWLQKRSVVFKTVDGGTSQ